MTLYRVAAFWHSLYVLYKADEAEKPLAGHLFRYEFAYWARQMKWLVHNIKQKDSRFPDVLDPFLSTDWFVEAQPLIDTVSGFGVNN